MVIISYVILDGAVDFLVVRRDIMVMMVVLVLTVRFVMGFWTSLCDWCDMLFRSCLVEYCCG